MSPPFYSEALFPYQRSYDMLELGMLTGMRPYLGCEVLLNFEMVCSALLSSSEPIQSDA